MSVKGVEVPEKVGWIFPFEGTNFSKMGVEFLDGFF